MNLDQEELRNRRIFEIIPQFTNINSGSGASGLKLVLGPNQMGFTLSDNNVNPELIYRLPDTWVGRSALNEGTTSWTDSVTGENYDAQFSTFVPKFGNAFFTGLKIRYFNSDNYSWAVPYIYKQAGVNNIPVSTVDLQNHINFSGLSSGGNDYLHGTFATNRQVLAYFYQFVSHLATVGGLPQSNTFMYTDKNGTGSSPSYDLILEFHNQLIPVITNIGTNVFVTNTEFNTYKNTINSQFDAVYSSMIAPPVVQASPGAFALWDTNSNMNELDQSVFYFNTTTDTLETENITLSGNLEVVEIVAAPNLPLSLTSDTEYFDFNFSNAQLVQLNADGTGTVSLSNGTDTILSLNSNNSVSLMNTLRTINGQEFDIAQRMNYVSALAATSDANAILSQSEIQTLIDNQTVYLDGTDDFILYKDGITSQTTNAFKRIVGIVDTGGIFYDTFSLINNAATFGYLDLANTARTLYDINGDKLINAGAFLSFLEIENVIVSKFASNTFGLEQISVLSGNELNTLRVNSSNEIEAIDYLVYVDGAFVDNVTYPLAPGDIDFSYDRQLKIQNNTMLFSDGMWFNEGNPTIKPLSYITTLIDRYPGSTIEFEKYIPNTLEIVTELDARAVEANIILEELLFTRPEKEFLKIGFSASPNGAWVNGEDSYDGSIVQRGSNEFNGIMMDSSNGTDGTIIRINSLIQLNGNPTGPYDAAYNKAFLEPILGEDLTPISSLSNDTVKWYDDINEYANPNINMIATPNSNANEVEVLVQPHQVSILSWIDYANTPINGTEYGTSLGMVISPLTYTYSSDYIKYFMQYRTGNQNTPDLTQFEVSQIIDQQIRNIGMYTNRDILPKIAVADLCDAKIASIPSQFYNTMINTKYKVHAAPVVATEPVDRPTNDNPNAKFDGWTQGSIGLSTGYPAHTITDANQWLSTVTGFSNDMFNDNHWLYFTDRDPSGNLYNFLLTQGLTVGDLFEIDILRLRTDWVPSLLVPTPTLDDYTVDGTLVYSIIGDITSALVPAEEAGYAPKWVTNNTAPDFGSWEIDYNVHVYRLGVVLNTDLTTFPEERTGAPAFVNWLFTVNDTPYIRFKLQITSKQMWNNNLEPNIDGNLQDVCDRGRTTDTGIVIQNVGLKVVAGGAQIEAGALVVRTSTNTINPIAPNNLRIDTFGGGIDGISYNSYGGHKSFRIKYDDALSGLSSTLDLYNNNINLKLYDNFGAIINNLEISDINIQAKTKVTTTINQTALGYTFDPKEFITKEFLNTFASGINIGTTLERPDPADEGLSYFDTTLGYPIWRFNGNWVNATGAIV